MISSPARVRAPHRFAVLATALAIAFGAAYALPAAQTPAKKVLTVDDYTKWRSISGQDISSDGKWVVYGVSYTNTQPADAKPVLHLLNLETNKDTEIPNATSGSFSADSKWLAYQVDPGQGGRGGRGNRGGGAGAGAPTADAPAGGAQTPPAGGATTGQTPGQGAQGRGAGATQPAPIRKVELRNLATGEVAKSWQDIASFTFSADSNFLLLRRRPAQAGGGAAGRGGDTGGAAPAAGGGGQGGGAAAAPANPDAARGVVVTLVLGIAS